MVVFPYPNITYAAVAHADDVYSRYPAPLELCRQILGNQLPADPNMASVSDPKST